MLLQIGILVACGIFILTMKILNARGSRIQIEKSKREIELFKKSANVIKADTTSYQVVSNNYYDEVPKSNVQRIQMYDALLDPANSTKRVRRDLSRIILDVDIDGKVYQFVSPVITKDETTLRFLLANQDRISVYFKKDDLSRYFVDLDFLI